MSKIMCYFLPELLILGATLLSAGPQPRSPRQLFPGLFEAVQLGRIFPDNKTFVDARPRQRPATILAAWRGKNQPGFNLKAFVLAGWLAAGARRSCGPAAKGVAVVRWFGTVL